MLVFFSFLFDNLSGPITHLSRLFHAAPDLSRAKINVCPARTHANRASDAAGVLRVVASPRLVPVSQPTFLSSSYHTFPRARQSIRRFLQTNHFVFASSQVPNKEPSKNDALVSIPNPPVRENASVLNLAKDLNAGALVAEAMKTLGDSLTDEDKAKITRGMEIQSEADVKMFNELASTMIANFERVVGTERSATDELIAAINVLEARADEATRRIENVKEQAARDKESALKEQESKMKAEHADFLVAERIERIKALDEERLRVSALRKVLTKRREALERAYAVQSFELAVIDLGARLEDGEAFDETLKLLKTCSKDDPFVATIVGTVSESVATSGVSTRLQLAEQLERVRQTARQLSLVPAEGGGMFAHGLAYTASLLRMKDSSEDGAQGIEGAIARAEAFLAQGQLTDAASALADAAKGTKAEPSVSDWARNVKNRANLEQAQAALSAHAQCRASALV